MELIPYIFLSVFHAYLIYLDFKKPNFPFSATIAILFIIQALLWLSGIKNTVYAFDPGGNASYDGQFLFHTFTYTSSYLAIIFFLFFILYLVKSFYLLVEEAEKNVKGVKENE